MKKHIFYTSLILGALLASGQVKTMMFDQIFEEAKKAHEEYTRSKALEVELARVADKIKSAQDKAEIEAQVKNVADQAKREYERASSKLEQAASKAGSDVKKQQEVAQAQKALEDTKNQIEKDIIGKKRIG